MATVHVIATTFEGTREALRAAIPLASGSGAALTLVVPQIVPYSTDIDAPLPSTAFLVKRYQQIIESLHGVATIDVCHCRSLDQIFAKLATADATIVVGGPAGRWITSPEERFAGRLAGLGYRVMFVAAGANPTQRRVAPVAAMAAIAFLALTGTARAEESASKEELLRRLTALETQIAELKALIEAPAAEAKVAATTAAPSPTEAVAESLHNLTIGVALDTYYGYNFNQPIGRVNLLRAYDVTSNNFSLNQASLVLESAPDLAANRRFGGRVDLQWGQATETLQGSLTNEPRPWVYRNVFQAYGTYVVPVGSGLSVDFGKWSSALGYENNYTKDQINYSRSFWFNFLPFYHTGARINYKFNDAFALNYWITNGTQQTEAFNNFKDQFVGVALQPSKNVSWAVNYYLGQEHPDVQTVVTPGSPTLPTQPGLSVVPVRPYFTGKLQIFDTTLNWQANPQTTIAFEGDFVSNQNPGGAAATSSSGGAAYLRRQLTPNTALGVRAEYVHDGGLFTGVAQSIAEATVTYDYRVNDGFLIRSEWRHDAAGEPFFLTDTVGQLKTSQDTATLGLVWWWGTKRGAW
jgi:hypothetical protein